MSQMGQKAEYSLRVDVFRFAPNNGHRQTDPTGPASSGPEKPRKPSRTEEAQRIVEEYADGLREILKKLRKLFH